MDDAEETEEYEEWQWWRISFSVEDAEIKAKEAGRELNPPAGTLISGYRAFRATESEALEAARRESNRVLLVYANEDAIDFPVDYSLSDPLQVIF